VRIPITELRATNVFLSGLAAPARLAPRESLGLRDELLSTPYLTPPQFWGLWCQQIDSQERQGASRAGAITGGAATGEMRVMCNQASGVAYAERGSDMGSFIGQVRCCLWFSNFGHAGTGRRGGPLFGFGWLSWARWWVRGPPHGRSKRSKFCFLGRLLAGLYQSKYAKQACTLRRKFQDGGKLARESYRCLDVQTHRMKRVPSENPELCAKHPVLKFMVSESCIFRRPVRWRMSRRARINGAPAVPLGSLPRLPLSSTGLDCGGAGFEARRRAAEAGEEWRAQRRRHGGLGNRGRFGGELWLFPREARGIV